MSSHKQSRGGRAKNTKAYRPWNAAALGKSSSGSSSQYAKHEIFNGESMDIDEKSESSDTAQFRPWNTTALNKSDIIENESSVSIA